MNIHFIGIGGIGVSALAKYYKAKGNRVTGSDLTKSETTEALKKQQGIKIKIGPHKPTSISKDVDLVIYSPAVQNTNPEFKQAKKQKSRLLSYPEALGELTKDYYTIAVSGTHGKSTTTAMIGLLLAKAGLDPTVIVGTKLKEFGDLALRESNGSNCRVGKSKYLVIEADEHFASFLNYYPRNIVLTSIEADHLDYYKNLPNLLKAFQKFVSRLPKDGVLIYNKDDANTQKILKSFKFQVSRFNYSLRQKEAAKLRKILKVPGEHNVSNALAALAVARTLNIPDKKSFKALSEFKGTWRRFEIFRLKTPSTSSGQAKSYTLVSDYGHHPTEIKVTVEAARSKWPKKNIWLIFQPHQYQRTYYLFDDFVEVLSHLPIQKLILIDIYDVPGRKGGILKKNVSSKKLIHAILNSKSKIQNSVSYIPTARKVETYLQNNLRGGEIVIIMGAGDIYDLTVRLTQSN